MRIAVIDDEKYSRIVLTHQIRQLLPQAEVAQAASGAQAMDLIFDRWAVSRTSSFDSTGIKW